MTKMLFSKNTAKSFFDQLRSFSIEVMEYEGLPTHPAHKTRPWAHGHPVGVTEHFTAGVTWKGSIRWLNGADNDAASCHFLILDRFPAEYEAIRAQEKYNLLDGLDVLVLQLSDLTAGNWHAGWVNSLCVGIENRNAGPLRGQQESWTWWPNKWTKPFPHEGLGKTPVHLDGRWWEPYTVGQVKANILLCQMLVVLYPLDPRWFIPHSAVAETKWDTGRAFPLNKVRDAVFGQTLMSELPWLHDFKADPMYMDDYDEEEDAEFLAELIARQADRTFDEDLDLEELVQLPTPDVQALVQKGDWKKELGQVRIALDRLGYYVPASQDETLDDDTATAVYIFQRSVGLKADKIPGEKTQVALYKRLKQFGLQ